MCVLETRLESSVSHKIQILDASGVSVVDGARTVWQLAVVKRSDPQLECRQLQALPELQLG